MESSKVTVGLLLFPNLTQLDATEPYEVFARMPGATVALIAATAAPIRSERGLTISPDATFENAPALDVICVPGGVGVNAAMEDQPTLAFLRQRAGAARYVTSVCTGALLLGAAGLLRGYRATSQTVTVIDDTTHIDDTSGAFPRARVQTRPGDEDDDGATY